MLYNLGAVPYLNALPLIHFLDETPRLAPPGPLVRLLKIGEVDIATAPITAWFENPNYSLIPGICIASNGPVRSVKLFFTKPGRSLENVEKIYLDMESRTSALLLKVILQFKYHRNLAEIEFYSPIPPREIDAKLLIGDKAMREITEHPPVDLGQEWTDWTGLPFVYAAWISRLPTVSDRAVQELTRARDRGVAAISSVIPEKSGFSRQQVEEYLQGILYHLGPKEMEGMRLFREYLNASV